MVVLFRKLNSAFFWSQYLTLSKNIEEVYCTNERPILVAIYLGMVILACMKQALYLI